METESTAHYTIMINTAIRTLGGINRKEYSIKYRNPQLLLPKDVEVYLLNVKLRK